MGAWLGINHEDEGKWLSLGLRCRQKSISLRTTKWPRKARKNMAGSLATARDGCFFRHRTYLNTCDRFFSHFQLPREDPFYRDAINQGVQQLRGGILRCSRLPIRFLRPTNARHSKSVPHKALPNMMAFVG